MAFHVAAVVEAGQRVGDRHLDRLLHVVAQPLGVALLADLGAHARQQLVLVDRPHQIVVDADLQPAHQPRVVLGLGDRQDRHVAGALERAHLAAQPQPVEVLQRRATRSAGRSRPRRRGTAPRCGFGSTSTVCSRRQHRRRCARRTIARSSTSRMRPLRPVSASASRSGILMPISREVTARMRSSSVIIFSRASERTRAISATSDTGLVRKSSAPASSPRTRSDGWSSAVTITTGMWWVAGLVLSRRQTSKPSMSGIITSSSTMSHSRALADRQRLGAAHRGHDVEILGRQPRFQQLDVGRNVVDDEDARGHRRTPQALPRK